MSAITPGIYPAMSNDEYHAQHEWASSTGLKAHLPERYKTGGSQEALDFGTLFHTAVLEPHNLTEYVALDAEKIGLKADGTPAQNPTMTAAWKRAVAEAESGGKAVIAQADLDQALAMAEAVRAHDTANNLLHAIEGAFEESAFAVVDDVPCRARFDKRIPGALLDLKSTSAKPGRESLTRAILDYGYDLSAAHYLAVARELGIDADAFALIFVAKVEPFYVTVVDLDETFLARGRVLRQQAIDRRLNRAEPYDGATGYLTATCPKWAQLTEEYVA